MMKEMRFNYPVPALSRMLKVSTSGYYAWSGKGNCYDNAPMESFWETLKQELVHHHHYRTRQEARREITEYIDIFYNRLRIQSKLGFLSPIAYARRFYSEVLAA
jgi:putative transposase